MVAVYNTFITGTIASVSIRDDGEIADTNRWTVAVDIDKIFRGEQTESKKWTIFVHSPTQEFGDYKTVDDLRGRRCIWALTVKDGKIFAKEAPFLFQKFEDSDVDMLREVLNESVPEKKP